MRLAKLLTSVAALAIGAVVADPAAAQRVVVFGDSLSDSGNAFAATGGTTPNSPLGRFSNGYNWADLLYGTNPSLGFVTSSVTGYDNYAFGGAFTGSGNLNGGGAPGILDEINLFTANGGKFAPKDTVTIWGGANNGFLALNTTPTQAGLTAGALSAVSSEVTDLTKLIGLGAKKIIVVNLPDLGSTPLLNGSSATASGGSFYSNTFNQALSTSLTSVAASAPGVNIIQVDVATLFRIVINNPGAFGFTNTTAACGFKGACAGYVFGDSVHPTQAAYAYVAQYVGLLSDTSPALLLTARLSESGLYVNELVSNQVFDRLSSFVSGTYADRNGPYAELIGSYGTYQSSGSSDLTVQIGGVRAGIDHKSGATLTGGSITLLTGSQSAGMIKSDIASYRADVYATALYGNVYVSADGGISSLQLSGIERQTGLPTVVAKGHTNGYVATAAGEVGVAQQVGAFTIIPSARLTYFHTQLDGYDEAGDLLTNSYSEQQTDALLLGGKVRAVTPVPDFGITATAFGEVGYEGFVSNSSNSLTGQLIGNTALPTTVKPGDPNGPGIIGKLGLSSQVTVGTFLDFQYGISVHDGGGETHSGDIRLKATY